MEPPHPLVGSLERRWQACCEPATLVLRIHKCAAKGVLPWLCNGHEGSQASRWSVPQCEKPSQAWRRLEHWRSQHTCSRECLNMDVGLWWVLVPIPLGPHAPSGIATHEGEHGRKDVTMPQCGQQFLQVYWFESGVPNFSKNGPWWLGKAIGSFFESSHILIKYPRVSRP